MAKPFRKLKFKIYPDPTNPHWFCRVEVLKSTKLITKEYYSRHKVKEEKREEIAGLFTQMFCLKCEKGKKAVRTGEFGRIQLGIDDLSVNYVVHECGHAAHEYCRRRHKNRYKNRGTGINVTDDEEVFCYALGCMSDQILARLFKQGYAFHAD